MDCSRTLNGNFEMKGFVTGGIGWETGNNHVATCGKLNVFRWNNAASTIINIP
jgi:hypothetical protein